MVAIEIKYLGPTNFKGSRYKASANGHSVIVSANYSLNAEENAKNAANTLKAKMGWKGRTAIGGTEKGWAVVFV